MGIDLRDLKKRAKEYVEVEARTIVLSVKFAERFTLFGRENVALLVETNDKAKKDREWWVIGGATPMNLYRKADFPVPGMAFTLHLGLIAQLQDREFRESKKPPATLGYDAFICHASEDKDAVVRPLARALTALGATVWYDEFEMRVGDSLRRSIDKGLVNSRFGIVVFSKAFFRKKWTQHELDGLIAKEIEGKKVILPVWHGITKKHLLNRAPSLADKFAVSTQGKPMRKIARALIEAME